MCACARPRWGVQEEEEKREGEGRKLRGDEDGGSLTERKRSNRGGEKTRIDYHKRTTKVSLEKMEMVLLQRTGKMAKKRGGRRW